MIELNVVLYNHRNVILNGAKNLNYFLFFVALRMTSYFKEERMKSSVLGIFALIAGTVLVFVADLPFGVLVFCIAWAFVLLFEDDILKATEITGWIMGVGFSLWCALWFYNGPHILGPNLSDLKLGMGGAIASASVGGICTFARKRRDRVRKRSFFVHPR
jgi:hypothetical protein